MIRQFLALLALLTGLTTFATPAQARVAVCEDVSVQAAGEAAADAQLVTVCAAICASARPFYAVAPAAKPVTQGFGRVQTVLMQVDRAHE